MVEKAGTLCIWDLETGGLGADYQRIILATIKPYKQKPITFIAKRFRDEKALVKRTKELLEKYDILVAHNGKNFDIQYLNTRLLYWGQQPLVPKHHIDTYQQLKWKLRTSSKSQAALLKFFKLEQQKMDLPQDTWPKAPEYKEAMKELIERNITDCVGLEQLYDRTKFLFRDIKCT